SVCSLSAFITLGRLTVTVATAPAFSTWRFSWLTGLPLLSGRRDHGALLDELRLEGPVGRVLPGADDLVDHVEAADELPEAGVLAVERGVVAVHDEELARGRVRIARPRHREDAAHV